MKSKAPLLMMEQMIMILVFALAAALCLQAFVLSERISQEGEQQDRAVSLCQNAAETLRLAGLPQGQALEEASKQLGGRASGEMLEIYYDGEWAVSAQPDAYRISITLLPEEVPGLCSARLEAAAEGGGSLFVLEKVSWQEVG